MSENIKTISIDIVWDSCVIQQWREYFNLIEKSNIIQTGAYARALRDIGKQNTRFGVIELEGKPLGILQIQEIKLFGFIHFIFLDRGPLWFEKPNDNIIEAFFKKLNYIFPKKFGRKRRIMPELPDNLRYQEIMRRSGFEKKNQGYRSIWLDLSPSLDVLRGKLDGKWRNALNKAEKSDLVIIETPAMVSLSWLLNVYTRDKIEKRYQGASHKLIDKIVAYSDGRTVMPLLLRSSFEGEDAAAILVFIHGNTATYQIGWTNNLGRDKKAHNLLLWNAIEILHNKGVKWFDLGGINPDTAKGVTKFKQGMGGESYTLIGVYR